MANGKTPQPLAWAGAANPNSHNVVNVNKLKALSSNPKVDIPIF
jgi:hypothetical protein